MKDLKKTLKKKTGKIDTHLGQKCLKKCKEIISMKITGVVTFIKERRDVIERTSRVAGKESSTT